MQHSSRHPRSQVPDAAPNLAPTRQSAAVALPMPPNSEFDLHRFLQMLQRRLRIVTGVAGLAMIYLIWSTLNQAPVYQSSFRLLVEPVNADNKLTDLTETQGPPRKSDLDYDTQIQVLRSPELIAKIAAQVESVELGAEYQFSPQSLKIVRIGETKIIEVSYEGDEPATVKTVLDQAAQVYLNYSLAERQTNLRQGILFVEKQLPALQQRVDALQDELQTFRQRYDFSDPDTQTSQISGQQQDIEQQQQDVNQKLLQARFNLSALKGEGSITALNRSEAYQQSVKQLREIETQIASELTRLQPQSLTIRALEDKRQSLLPFLRQEAKRSLGAELAEAAIQIESLELQQTALAQAKAKLDVQKRQLPVLSRNYVDLQRELQIASDSLNRFRTSRETLMIDAAQTEIPWELIQAPGQPQLANSHNISQSLLMGLLISAALGIGAAIGLEKLDSTYQSADDLKQQTKLPVLGVLPLYQPAQDHSTSALQKLYAPIVKRFGKRSRRRLGSAHSAQIDRLPASSSFVEALRVLYTNLQLLSATRSSRSVVITSALSGDGKSTVAFHLAQTARAMGQKVLLIDTDLRRPQLHQWLNLSNQCGLSDVIAGTVSLKAALVQSHPTTHFFVLTAGSIPADPTQLLASAKMKQLMKWCHHTFDLVIYDTPPLLGLADASLLAATTDGLLVVTRLGKTDRAALDQALEGLKLAQVPVLGLVANGLQHGSFRVYGAYGYENRGNRE